MMKLKKDDLILVDWVDSSGQPGWLSKQDCHIDISQCQSEGFLIEYTKEGICLAESRCTTIDHRPYSGLTSIPKQAIIKIKKLK